MESTLYGWQISYNTTKKCEHEQLVCRVRLTVHIRNAELRATGRSRHSCKVLICVDFFLVPGSVRFAGYQTNQSVSE